MKILQLRFRNLNSLAGEWSIDFTVPEYVADGIFAISGPTGAGKSTILDAICLALYWRTPRLPVISNSTNEIMSRQTGDCFAEVVFETNEGRFKPTGVSDGHMVTRVEHYNNPDMRYQYLRVLKGNCWPPR
jgi:exonuclease SbcC